MPNYYFQDGSDTNVVINGSGNVGIGTQSPNEKLTVEGVMSLKEGRPLRILLITENCMSNHLIVSYTLWMILDPKQI